MTASRQRRKYYKQDSWGETITGWLKYICPLLVLTSIGLCICATQGWMGVGKVAIGTLAATWAIGAPTWFWYEYFFLFRRDGIGSQKAWEYFKYGQQVGVAVWAGVATSLGVFATSSAIPESELLKCEIKTNNPKEAVPKNSALTLSENSSMFLLSCK